MLPPLAVASAVGIAASWFHRAEHVCSCRCDTHADPQILDILREQLRRCGPEQLTPTCPVCRCEVDSRNYTQVTILIVLAVFVVGLALGWLAHAHFCRAAASGRPAAAPVGLTPSALRALKDGRPATNVGPA